jgi:hypothetical protein
MKALQLVCVALLAVASVVASHPSRTLYYSDAEDYRDAGAIARAYQFDALDEDDVDIDDFQCFSLDDYNRRADRNRFDRFERLGSSNIRKADLRRLDRDDYNRIADENQYDDIRRDDVDTFKDMRCWDLRDYNGFADTNRADKWKRIDFRDPDDGVTVQKIGTSRYHFFSPGDFDRANLHLQRPTRFVPRNGRRVVLPYGAVNYDAMQYR